jgi:hypothetical protein
MRATARNALYAAGQAEVGWGYLDSGSPNH